MNTRNLKLYQLFSHFPVLQKSYTLKIAAIASIGILIPPLMFVALGHLSVSSDNLTVLGLATLVGILITTFLLKWLLYPIHQTSITLRQFLNGEQTQPINFEEIAFKDSVGQLMTEVEYITHKMSLLNHSLKDHSTFDPLTGVLNYRAAQAHLRLDMARARREAKPMLVALVEVEQLRNINEQFGYQIGDLYLTEVAKILSRSIRESDWVARWKGNQFLMVLWNFNNAMPTTIFMRIQQQSVKIPINTLPQLSLTMGAYEYKPHQHLELNADLVKLLVHVDDSLAQIKQNHRGNIVLTQSKDLEEDLTEYPNEMRHELVSFCS